MSPSTGGVDATLDEESGLLNRVIAQLVVTHSGCWVWSGARNKDGYGSVRDKGKWWSIHRYVYTTLVGPIPEGKELDHFCKVRACANPDHLDPVTHQENVARGGRFPKTHCRKGHEYSEANTYKCSDGSRRCRTCLAVQQNAYYRRKTRQ